jgi:LysR family hydrogen peroxide-inducible transcriptional activator
MKNITLKHLRYACAVADQGHFGRAADMQSVSQPALSMQVKDLEERLGQPLFERGPRMVRPTVFGEDFLQRARAILQSVEALLRISADERFSPFPRRIYPTAFVTGMPRAV